MFSLARRLLQVDRVEEGLEIAGVHLEQASGGAERVAGIVDLLISVHQLIEDAFLDHAVLGYWVSKASRALALAAGSFCVLAFW